MDRRKSLKVITLATLGAGTVFQACNTTDKKATAVKAEELYGRTPEEKAHNERLQQEKFFTEHELATITVLCDIIISADDVSGSASEAGVPAFVEFTMKDRPAMKLPMRGGLKWLDIKSLKLFGKNFVSASKEQQIELVDLIAYPEDALPANMVGVGFFNTLRNLTATGFFTSKMGLQDLGYMGNQPNAWDGVPTEVLHQYGLAYDDRTLAISIKPEDRGKIMEWDS